MRKLFLILTMLPMPCQATWTLTHYGRNSGCSGTSCVVTTSATISGNALIAGEMGNTSSTGITSVTAGACNTSWTHFASANINGTGGSVDLFYCLNAVGGITSITINTNSTVTQGFIWEANSTLGMIALDAGTTPSGSLADAACTSCAGKALTLSGNNNFIAILNSDADSCTGLTGSGFTNDSTNNGNCSGHGITSGSLTAPATWTNSSSAVVNLAAGALQETASAGAGGFSKRSRMERLEE